VLLFGAAALALALESAAADQPLDPSARPQVAGDAWQYWDLTTRLDSGHHVFARFWITNAGPGSQTGVALGYVVAPDGTAHRFKNGRRQARWTLSEDRRQLDMGSSHLTLRQPAYRLQIEKGSVRVDLRFGPETGFAVPDEVTPKGYGMAVLALSSSTEGQIWTQGMSDELEVRGRTGLVHTWADEPEGELILRRVEFFSLESEPSLYVLDLTTPEGVRTQLCVSDSETVELFPSSHGAAFRREAGWSSTRDYWLPESMEFGDDRMRGTVQLEQRLHDHQPLGVIPLPSRWFFSRGMQPFQVWAQTPFHVTLSRGSGELPRQTQGIGVTVVTFLNPVARPDEAH
jgi:hypothetical protein